MIQRKHLILAVLAASGLGVGHSHAVTNPGSPNRAAALNSVQKSGHGVIVPDVFGGIGGSLAYAMSRHACPPHIYGQSRACRNLVRKNRCIARRSRHHRGAR